MIFTKFTGWFSKLNSFYKIISILSVLIGFVLSIGPFIELITPKSKYSVELFNELIKTYSDDKVNEIIKATNNKKKYGDINLFAKGLYAIMQPKASTKDPIYFLSKIPTESKVYKLSILTATHYLQEKDESINVGEAIRKFALTMKDRGDIGPLFDAIYYIESLISRDSYGIGDPRKLFAMDNINYHIRIESPQYFSDAYREIKKKYESKNFKITPNGVEMINTSRKKKVYLSSEYKALHKLLAAIQGGKVIAHMYRDENYPHQKELLNFCRVFNGDLNLNEKNKFLFVYGSVYLWLLDNEFKKANLVCKT